MNWEIKMESDFILAILRENIVFIFRLLPYLLAGLFVGTILEVALSRYKEIRWLKQPGLRSYLMISLVGIGTPL